VLQRRKLTVKSTLSTPQPTLIHPIACSWTLASAFLGEHSQPKGLIGDKAYDSDPLDELLLETGIEMIAPHRQNRKKRKSQDGRKLRRYKRRWKAERLIAWLQTFRRLVVRYEYKEENFLGMAQLGCIVILLRKCL
jgi:transposase